MITVLKAFGIGLLALNAGTLLLGVFLATIFGLTHLVTGFDMASEIPWLSEAIAYPIVGALLVVTAMMVGQHLGSRSVYLWIWPAVTATTSALLHALGDAPIPTLDIVLVGVIPLLTIIYIHFAGNPRQSVDTARFELDTNPDGRQLWFSQEELDEHVRGFGRSGYDPTTGMVHGKTRPLDTLITEAPREGKDA